MKIINIFRTAHLAVFRCCLAWSRMQSPVRDSTYALQAEVMLSTGMVLIFGGTLQLACSAVFPLLQPNWYLVFFLLATLAYAFNTYSMRNVYSESELDGYLDLLSQKRLHSLGHRSIGFLFSSLAYFGFCAYLDKNFT